MHVCRSARVAIEGVGDESALVGQRSGSLDDGPRQFRVKDDAFWKSIASIPQAKLVDVRGTSVPLARAPAWPGCAGTLPARSDPAPAAPTSLSQSRREISVTRTVCRWPGWAR